MADSAGRTGPLFDALAADHLRLDALLREALADAGRIDVRAYEAFRTGLLQHIAMEEKVLLPDVVRRNGAPLSVSRQLRLDHAALAALLVPSPTRALLETIEGILRQHNPIEEGPGGVYATCERLAGAEADGLVTQMRAVPPVKVKAHFDSPRIHEHIEQLLRARTCPEDAAEE